MNLRGLAITVALILALDVIFLGFLFINNLSASENSGSSLVLVNSADKARTISDNNAKEPETEILILGGSSSKGENSGSNSNNNPSSTSGGTNSGSGNANSGSTNSNPAPIAGNFEETDGS